jgi:hypothetical protein
MNKRFFYKSSIVLSILLFSFIIYKYLNQPVTKQSPPTFVKDETAQIGSSKETTKEISQGPIQQDESSAADPELIESLGHVVGRDDVGIASTQIISSALLNKLRKPTNPKDRMVCKSNATCPIAIEKFYPEALRRISIAKYSNAKALLQEEMLASELPKDSKINLLIEDLTSKEYESIEPTSGRTEGGSAALSPDAMFIAATQLRLFELSPDANTAIKSTMTAISHNQDAVVQMMLAIRLIAKYPENRNEIEADLLKFGITPEMLIKSGAK